MGLAELLHQAKKRGYINDFAIENAELCCDDAPRRYAAGDARIVETMASDEGTDPGDDATLYLIETVDGTRGYIVTSDSFHADPDKAALIDQLRVESSRATR